jgi:membrane protein
VLTVCLSVLGLIALGVIVYIRQIGNTTGQRLAQPFIWPILQWTITAILLLFSTAVIYRFGPNLNDRRWQWSIPGAVLATALWIPLTSLLRFYAEHFSSSTIYGRSNAVVTLLLWLYITSASIFIGGEANSEIEKAAAEAHHPDVRDVDEPRSGGEDGPTK